MGLRKIRDSFSDIVRSAEKSNAKPQPHNSLFGVFTLVH